MDMGACLRAAVHRTEGMAVTVAEAACVAVSAVGDPVMDVTPRKFTARRSTNPAGNRPARHRPAAVMPTGQSRGDQYAGRKQSRQSGSKKPCFPHGNHSFCLFLLIHKSIHINYTISGSGIQGPDPQKTGERAEDFPPPGHALSGFPAPCNPDPPLPSAGQLRPPLPPASPRQCPPRG